MTDAKLEGDPHIWSEMAVEFEIRQARVVATLGEDRGAIVENVRRLICSEGRLYSIETDGDESIYQLEYHFGFSACEEAEPYPSTSVPGRIVITGTHSNGQRLEVRGHGWIGYDEAGNVEGRFDKPPVLITEDADQDEYDEPEEPSRRITSGNGLPLPPQFMQATLRVPPSEWED